MNVFKFNSYRELILHSIESDKHRGVRKKLANAASCSQSWLTRALAGDVHLTPDQGLGVATCLNLSEIETDYFLLLIDCERAGSPLLKKRILKKIEDIKDESRLLKNLLKSETSISEKHLLNYYSSWAYAAIHVACMIKHQSPKDISLKFNIPETVAANHLKALREMGLVETVGPLFQATSKSIHLPSDHPIAKIGHSTWRNRTIHRLQEGHQDELHYSAVHCLSEKDAEKIHELLKTTIIDCRAIIERSTSETLSVFCIDWYPL